MRKIIIVSAFLSSLALSEVPPGTPPDWWCRAEPVHLNGDDYLRFAKTAEAACTQALKECEDHYSNCNITGCGEWSDKLTNFEGYCNQMD